MEDPIVETCSGKIRGCVERSVVGDDYFAFKGIPYAKPPLKELRFQDPLPVAPWNDVKDCKNFGPIATQSEFLTEVISGSEDCLYLNVYTKNLETHSRLPVMVWIHGGAFVSGSGNDDDYGPDYLIRKDIVLVTINYRLGVLGFLNLDSEVAPGNQGLKDQIMALQWVHNNIANFGGDSENVTIFGNSAGGICVHYLAVSPLAKGLFHKAIIQSGVIQNHWALNTRDEMKNFAYRLCEILGNNTKDDQEIVKFLKTIDSRKLIEAQEKCLTPQEKLHFMLAFVPGIDEKSKNPVMPVHPSEAAEEGIQVPLLIGCNDNEGILFYEKLRRDLMSRSPRDFRNCLRPSVVRDLKNYGRLANDLRRFYFGGEELDENNQENMAKLMGDLYFVMGTHKTIKIQVEKSAAPTYFYRYTYDKTPSPLKKLQNTTLKGASHADELQHLFRARKFEQSNEPLLTKGTVSFAVMQQMVELWVNFASTGRPTPITSKLIPFYWQPVASDSILRYLNICEDMQMEVTLSLEQIFSCHKVPKIGT